jgi:predicted  nucleic acid-binding Zn-ribbon protein
MNDGLLTTHSRLIEPTPRDRVTAIANAMQRRPIVIVLGAPGSGASLCAHILSALGVDMVGVETGSGAGPWERAELVALHDRILALFNRAHLGPFHDFALPVAWWADPRVAGIKREIVACLEARIGAGYFGFKDPRAVRLLPVWQHVANELKLAPRLVLCLRNPAQIAALWNTRDGLDPAIGEYRWLANTVDFFRHANSFDICTVEYESWFEDPSVNITTLKEFLGLEWQHGESDLSLLVSGIVDAAAPAEQAGRREPSQPLVRSLYKLARRACGDGGAREQISNIAFQFVGFQQLQRPFQLAFEEVAKTAAKFPAIERELDVLRTAAAERDALRATLAEREAAITQLSRKVDDVTTSLQSAQAERTTQQEAVQRAEQAVQQQAVSAEAMQGEIAALGEALARAERAAEERGATADAMQSEIAVLREALERMEQEAQQREAAAAAVAAELTIVRGALAQAEGAAKESQVAAENTQAEAAALREALVRSELLSSERATACAAVQSEVSALRERLALGEREREEHAVARKALQREFMALRQALKQAEREVQQSADGTRAMQSERVKLRNALAATQSATEALHRRLAQAEGEAAERAAAAKAFRAEIESLQDKLAAARQVGKVAIAALGIDTAAPAKPDAPHRWRQIFMWLRETWASF